jgi:hypothetical protein
MSETLRCNFDIVKNIYTQIKRRTCTVNMLRGTPLFVMVMRNSFIMSTSPCETKHKNECNVSGCGNVGKNTTFAFYKYAILLGAWVTYNAGHSRENNVVGRGVGFQILSRKYFIENMKGTPEGTTVTARLDKNVVAL